MTESKHNSAYWMEDIIRIAPRDETGASPRGAGDVTVIERKEAYRGFGRLDVVRLRYRREDGSMSEAIEREILQRGHGAAVLPVDIERDELVLVRQFRPGAWAAGWSPWTLECPSGLEGDERDARATACREALEETGCRIDDLVPIARCLSSPGPFSETVTVFCARVAEASPARVHGRRDEGEETPVHRIGVDEARRMLDAGEIRDSKTIIAMQYVTTHYETLKERWMGDAPNTEAADVDE